MFKTNARWLILIYANGNNDLEPEIYQSIQTVLATTWPRDIKIIIQLARAPRPLVRTLRPLPPTHNTGAVENWTGVRRYITGSHGDFLPSIQYGFLNMADPATLYDFLLWGLELHPDAAHVMVIISGHGGGFVGIMPDLTVAYPQLMSLTGLADVFCLLQHQTNRPIDVLMLDSCHMNMLEVWFELALRPWQPVSHLLVPGGENPLAGLPYPLLVENLHLCSHTTNSLANQLMCLTATINQSMLQHRGLMMVDLNKQYFNQLKQALHQLAVVLTKHNRQPAQFLTNLLHHKASYPLISLADLWATLPRHAPPTAAICHTMQQLWPQIIPAAPQGHTPGGHGYLYLNTGPGQSKFFQNCYHRLALARNNRWAQLINNNNQWRRALKIHKTSLKKPLRKLPAPLFIPSQHLQALIMQYNPGITDFRVQNILKKMGWLPPPHPNTKWY